MNFNDFDRALDAERLTPDSDRRQQDDDDIKLQIIAGDISSDCIAHAKKEISARSALSVMYEIDFELTETLITNNVVFSDMFVHFAINSSDFREFFILEFLDFYHEY